MVTGPIVKAPVDIPARFAHEDILIDGAIGFTSTPAGPMVDPSDDQSAIRIPTLVRVRSADGVPLERPTARDFSAAFWGAADVVSKTGQVFLTTPCLHMPRVYREEDDA